MLESPTIVTRQDILSIFNRLQLRILKISYFSELTKRFAVCFTLASEQNEVGRNEPMTLEYGEH